MIGQKLTLICPIKSENNKMRQIQLIKHETNMEDIYEFYDEINEAQAAAEAWREG